MRAFTRANIIEKFEQHWGKHYWAAGNTVEVGDVKLLKRLGKPVWVLDYTVVSKGSIIDSRYHSFLLFTQEKTLSGTMQLTTVDEVSLPLNCATVAEEDKAMKKQEEPNATDQPQTL